MADPKPVTSPVASLVFKLEGRISSVRRVSGKAGVAFNHVVRLPAPDEFTSPASVLVRSEHRHGDEGDKFSQLVQVGGYGRSYQVMDEETGRKVTVQTADNTLTVIG